MNRLPIARMLNRQGHHIGSELGNLEGGSLDHDDAIDGAVSRTSVPSSWRVRPMSLKRADLLAAFVHRMLLGSQPRSRTSKPTP